MIKKILIFCSLAFALSAQTGSNLGLKAAIISDRYNLANGSVIVSLLDSRLSRYVSFSEQPKNLPEAPILMPQRNEDSPKPLKPFSKIEEVQPEKKLDVSTTELVVTESPRSSGSYEFKKPDFESWKQELNQRGSLFGDLEEAFQVKRFSDEIFSCKADDIELAYIELAKVLDDLDKSENNLNASQIHALHFQLGSILKDDKNKKLRPRFLNLLLKKERDLALQIFNSQRKYNKDQCFFSLNEEVFKYMLEKNCCYEDISSELRTKLKMQSFATKNIREQEFQKTSSNPHQEDSASRTQRVKTAISNGAFSAWSFGASVASRFRAKIFG